MKKLYVASAVLGASLLALPAMAAVSGTALTVARPSLPPSPSDYVSPADIHAAIDDGTVQWARGDARHRNFFNIVTAPGGVLGGEVERFDSVLDFTFTGTGPLQGWSRTVSIPAKSETHIGPRRLDDPVQSFETLMYRIEGELKGDKDFESISIIAGTANGLDSPGHTTLYKQKDGTWLVDSRFNIKFVGKFRGAAGGKLAGLEDTFEGTITMVAVPPGATLKTATASR
jgi:hypothetical protein